MIQQFGLDIGAGLIKVAFLKKDGDQYQLLALGETAAPAGGWELPAGEANVAETIKKLVTDLGIQTKFVSLALPETKVISRTISFPPLKEAEVYKAIFYEAETFVPYPLDQVQIDYQVIESSPARSLVFVVACPRTTIEQYERIAKLAGLVPFAVETTSIALTRTFASDSPAPMMILDIGARNSTMVIKKNNAVLFTRSIPVGGEAFTKGISISLGIENFKAEEYKKAYGFEAGKWEDKIRDSLKSIFAHLEGEVKKGILAFREEWNEEVKFLTLCGGSAYLPQLSEELVKVFGMEVQTGQPLAQIKTEGARMITNEPEYARFAVAIGLAKREK